MDTVYSDGLVVIAEMDVLPERREAFLAYTVANLPVSRSARGNLRFDILVDRDRPNRVLFHEAWETGEAQQAYLAWRVAQGDLTTLMSFLAAEPKFTALHRIAA